MTFYDRDAMLSLEPVVCPKCGADVSDMVHVVPAFCHKMDCWCGFPCRRADDDYDETFDCRYRTPCEPLTMEVAE